VRKLLPFLLLLAAVTATSGDQTEVRVIQLRHKPARDGVSIAEGMLTENGSVMLQPRLNTLTVRDTAAVVHRIAEALASWDVAARPYRVRVRLVLASTEAAPAGQPAPRLVGLGSELARMFRWGGFEDIDTVEVEAQEGTAVDIKAAQGYTVRFSLRAVPADPQRVQLAPLEVTRLAGQEHGVGLKQRMLNLTVSLQLGQTWFGVTAKSEEAKRALVVIVAADRESAR
jgi:hypothetical protein